VGDAVLGTQLDTLASQVVGFARMRSLDDLSRAAAAAETQEG
jgi:hypothetical protein